MDIKSFRQFLKTFADDTRLRIVFLLMNNEPLMVKELQAILGISQPVISRHLVRLRLLKIVSDRREGTSMYYSLHKNIESEQKKILDFFFSQFSSFEQLKLDRVMLEKITNERHSPVSKVHNANP
jgi:ArsR family transcriptional regulator